MCLSTCARAILDRVFAHLRGWQGLGYRWPSTGVKRPLPGKLRKKSEKGFPGPLGPGVKKGSKKSRKLLFFRFLSSFWLVFDSFSTFFSGVLTPGPRGPGNPLQTFFRSFPGRGLFGPWRWPTTSKGGARCSLAEETVSSHHGCFLLNTACARELLSKGQRFCQTTARST